MPGASWNDAGCRQNSVSKTSRPELRLGGRLKETHHLKNNMKLKAPGHWLVLTVCGVLTAFGSDGNSPDAKASPPDNGGQYSSTAGLEADFYSVRDKISTISGEIETLTTARDRLLGARNDLEKLDPTQYAQQAADLSSKLAQAITNLAALKDDMPINTGTPQVQSFNEARGAISTLIAEATKSAVLDEYRNYTYAQQLTGDQQMLAEIARPIISPANIFTYGGGGFPFMVSYDMLGNSLFSQGLRKMSDIRPQVTDAQQQFTNLTGNIVAQIASLRTNSIAQVTNLASAFDAEAKKKQAQLPDLKKQSLDLDAKLKGGQVAQTDINRQLINTVYWEIGAVFALFLLVALMKQEVAKRLIENRTLFETVSLVFLMVTLVILGLAEKIGKETLGPLLGTIAGYLFGKELNRPRPGGSNHGNGQQQPQTPTAETPD